MAVVDMAIALLTVGVVVYLLTAFQSAAPPLAASADRRSTADRAAESLREMEADAASGKMTAEDYAEVRREVIAEIAKELKKS